MDPSAPTSSAAPPDEARESVKEADLFTAFDTYPWSKDQRFMDLIRKALQKPSPNPQAIIRHARTAYFTRVLGFPLSPESYAAFLAANPCHTPADDSLLAIIQGVPAWQVAAPKADLFVDKTVRDSGDGPSYPGRFAELIRCIKEGTPVPGVREIPDTILRDPSAKPFGSRPAPRKPWEKEMGTPEGSEAAVAPAVDQEFPPLDPATPSGEGVKGSAEGPEDGSSAK
ncbi:hypothetical protein VUR80DRAFT_7436 [Thermomyces stellatus]